MAPQGQTDDSSSANGVSLPMIGMDVNEHLPPAGEPYAHEDFRVGTDRCPVNNCEGQLNRVKVMAEDPNSGAPSHIETLEVSCLECQRIVFKTNSVEYDRGE